MSKKDNSVRSRMREVWNEIEVWYKENAPILYEDLRDGASEADLKEAEKKLGFPLPDDYRESLKIHNGRVYLHDYEYLDLNGAVRESVLMVSLDAEGKFEGWHVEGASDGKIQNKWWHKGWIPFAEDSGGNKLCIDMAPGPKGKKGQVLQMELGAGPFSTEYDSFLEYMEHYLEALKRGVYEVNSDGMLSQA